MIKKIVKIFLILLILITANPSSAGIIDLELELDLQDTSQLEYGQILPFSLTVTNNGPDAAAGTSDAFLPNSVFIRTIFENANGLPELVFAADPSIEQECFWVSIISEPLPIPGSEPSIAYLASMPIIPAGASVTCYGLVQSFVNVTDKEINFLASPFPDDTDTDLSNNSIDRIFGLKPRVIPSLNILSLIILSVLLLIIASFSLNKRLVEIYGR